MADLVRRKGSIVLFQVDLPTSFHFIYTFPTILTSVFNLILLRDKVIAFSGEVGDNFITTRDFIISSDTIIQFEVLYDSLSLQYFIIYDVIFNINYRSASDQRGVRLISFITIPR